MFILVENGSPLFNEIDRIKKILNIVVGKYKKIVKIITIILTVK